MSSVHPVPETSTMTGQELSADDARKTLREYGRLRLVKESFRRFHYADGFSTSRALALQLCLAVIPMVIAFVGLSRSLHAERGAEVITRTLLALTPGASENLVNQTLQNSQQNSSGSVALWLGLAAALAHRCAPCPRGIYGNFKTAPRRRQPGFSWLAFGSGVALVLWLAFTALLVLCVQLSGTFGSTYGPLTVVIALLLWASLTSMALFLGVAFAAQLEAVRAGIRSGAPSNWSFEREAAQRGSVSVRDAALTHC